jgi:lipid-binding SYLF domain-containing protein
MRNWTICLTLAAACAIPVSSTADDRERSERVTQATDVLQALVNAPDEGIPSYVLERAEAIVVVPRLVKGGLGFGAEHGRGIASVRNRRSNSWSPPAFVALTGGTFGFQIGLETIDLVLVMVERDGIDDLLKDEFTLGGGASVAAGPVGRAAEASTDLSMSAKILAYSRSKGLFAGATIEGSSLRADRAANRAFYGTRLDSEDILLERALAGVDIPSAADRWRSVLSRVARASRPSEP